MENVIINIMFFFGGSFLTLMIWNFVDYRTRMEKVKKIEENNKNIRLSGEAWKSEGLDNYHYSDEWEKRNDED